MPLALAPASLLSLSLSLSLFGPRAISAPPISISSPSPPLWARCDGPSVQGSQVSSSRTGRGLFFSSPFNLGGEGATGRSSTGEKTLSPCLIRVRLSDGTESCCLQGAGEGEGRGRRRPALRAHSSEGRSSTRRTWISSRARSLTTSLRLRSCRYDPPLNTERSTLRARFLRGLQPGGGL